MESRDRTARDAVTSLLWWGLGAVSVGRSGFFPLGKSSFCPSFRSPPLVSAFRLVVLSPRRCLSAAPWPRVAPGPAVCRLVSCRIVSCGLALSSLALPCLAMSFSSRTGLQAPTRRHGTNASLHLTRRTAGAERPKERTTKRTCHGVCVSVP